MANPISLFGYSRNLDRGFKIYFFHLNSSQAVDFFLEGFNSFQQVQDYGCAAEVNAQAAAQALQFGQARRVPEPDMALFYIQDAVLGQQLRHFRVDFQAAQVNPGIVITGG